MRKGHWMNGRNGYIVFVGVFAWRGDFYIKEFYATLSEARVALDNIFNKYGQNVLSHKIVQVDKDGCVVRTYNE